MKKKIVHAILSLFSNKDLIEHIKMRKEMGAEIDYEED